jgi:hypothetical protein
MNARGLCGNSRAGSCSEIPSLIFSAQNFKILSMWLSFQQCRWPLFLASEYFLHISFSASLLKRSWPASLLVSLLLRVTTLCFNYYALPHPGNLIQRTMSRILFLTDCYSDCLCFPAGTPLANYVSFGGSSERQMLNASVVCDIFV